MAAKCEKEQKTGKGDQNGQSNDGFMKHTVHRLSQKELEPEKAKEVNFDSCLYNFECTLLVV